MNINHTDARNLVEIGMIAALVYAVVTVSASLLLLGLSWLSTTAVVTGALYLALALTALCTTLTCTLMIVYTYLLRETREVVR